MEIKKVNVFENIEKVIFNKPATIVIFKDGSKSVAKCSKGDFYDPFVGYLVALAKYVVPKGCYVSALLSRGSSGHLAFMPNDNNESRLVIQSPDFGSFMLACDVAIVQTDIFSPHIRDLQCILLAFANDFADKYYDKYFDELYCAFKKRTRPITNHTIDFDNIDNAIKEIEEYKSPEEKLINSYGGHLGGIIRTIPDKIVLDFDINEMYPKVCGVQRRSGRVPLKKRIDYDNYNICYTSFDDNSNNAIIFSDFLMDFNSTGSCSNEEYFRHATFGLMSELGELKELLTHIIYTNEYSIDNIAHMNRELSDIYWMLCEYVTYCDSSFDMGSFSAYIDFSIAYHECSNTKYSCNDCKQLNHILTVVDNMIFTVTKIMGIHQKILQGHAVDSFTAWHDSLICDIFDNMLYIVKYILRSTPSFFFRVSMDKVKKRYPDGWMDPERSINRKPEDV